jgi:hypothetical protein
VEAKACFYDVLMAAVPLVGIMLQFARGASGVGILYIASRWAADVFQ